MTNPLSRIANELSRYALNDDNIHVMFDNRDEPMTDIEACQLQLPVAELSLALDRLDAAVTRALRAAELTAAFHPLEVAAMAPEDPQPPAHLVSEKADWYSQHRNGDFESREPNAHR